MAFWFLSSPLLWNWGLPCLSAPAPLLLDLGCLRPNLADQSTRPGFSKTIFSTRSKLESQVALPDSIFPNTAACTCNNLGHSMYCDLYAVVFNISSRRQASLSGKLPPMITSISPATNKPNANFLKSISSPLHPHKYSGCRAACGYFCLFTIGSTCLSLMPEYSLPSGFWSLVWQTLFETRAADGHDKSCDCLCLFVLPCFRSRLAREKQRLVPLSELSGPRSAHCFLVLCIAVVIVNYWLTFFRVASLLLEQSYGCSVPLIDPKWYGWNELILNYKKTVQPIKDINRHYQHDYIKTFWLNLALKLIMPHPKHPNMYHKYCIFITKAVKNNMPNDMYLINEPVAATSIFLPRITYHLIYLWFI